MSVPFTAPLSTVTAIATPRGVGGIAIVRISGSHAYAVADRLLPATTPRPSERPAGTFFQARLRDPATGAHIDDLVILCFRAPHSYTGEDVIELHGHGGTAVSARVLQSALDAGAVLAGPGEFTRRAFLNGKLDLVQAEAVMDLIHARSERAVTAAAEQLNGALSTSFIMLYDVLMNCRADLEATLDFDDLDVDALPTATLVPRQLEEALTSIDTLLADWSEGHLLRDGALVPLVGAPNAGKSSLLNALLGHDRAIVTSRAGTTRDTIEEQCLIDGIPLRLVDTAGLRESDCEIEREGIARAQASMASAELTLFLLDVTTLPDAPSPALLRHHLQAAGRRADNALIALSKSDRLAPNWRDTPLTSAKGSSSESDPSLLFALNSHGVDAVLCSALTGVGVSALKRRLLERLGHQCGAPSHAVIAARHRAGLQRTRDALLEARHALAQGLDDAVLAAEALRHATHELGSILGRNYSEELLDRIFSRFCVGK